VKDGEASQTDGFPTS